MMALLRTWLLRLAAVSILSAVADTPMPFGGPKRVGRLLGEIIHGMTGVATLVMLISFISALKAVVP